MTLKEWIAEQDTADTSRLLKLVHAKPMTGTTSPDLRQQPRNEQRVADELRWNAALSADKALIETAFRLAGIGIGATTGDTTETVDLGSKPIYGKSPAQKHGWGSVTANDIEAAAAGHASPNAPAIPQHP